MKLAAVCALKFSNSFRYAFLLLDTVSELSGCNRCVLWLCILSQNIVIVIAMKYLPNICRRIQRLYQCTSSTNKDYYCIRYAILLLHTVSEFGEYTR